MHSFITDKDSKDVINESVPVLVLSSRAEVGVGLLGAHSHHHPLCSHLHVQRHFHRLEDKHCSTQRYLMLLYVLLRLEAQQQMKMLKSLRTVLAKHQLVKHFNITFLCSYTVEIYLNFC